MSMFQRCSAAITASASCRSGVTRAAVRSGVSSTSRMARAMVPASSARVAHSTIDRPVKAVAAKMWACLAKAAPVGAERGRLESLAHQVAAQGPGTEIDPGRLPDRDIRAGRIKRFQQQRQLVLRMAGHRRDPLPVTGGGTIQPLRKHHMPVRQPGDTGDKLTRRREGSGRPCHHDKLLWRITSPCLATQPDEPVSPVRRVKDTFLGEDRWPAVDENGQQFQNVLPVAREPVGKQFHKLFWRCVGIAERIEKTRQRPGKPDRLRRRERGVANLKPDKKPRQPQSGAAPDPWRAEAPRRRPPCPECRAIPRRHRQSGRSAATGSHLIR